MDAVDKTAELEARLWQLLRLWQMRVDHCSDTPRSEGHAAGWEGAINDLRDTLETRRQLVIANTTAVNLHDIIRQRDAELAALTAERNELACQVMKSEAKVTAAETRVSEKQAECARKALAELERLRTVIVEAWYGRDSLWDAVAEESPDGTIEAWVKRDQS